MASEEAKVEVSNARDRLSGALSHAVDRFGGSEEAGLQGVFGSPNKRLHSMDSPLASPSKSPRVVRRRRKKDINPASGFHHTFVMKLFDRSVDLAQFPEGTPLYPVCRAWMKNEPLNTNMAPRVRTPTPEPESPKLSEKEEGDGSEKVKEKSGDESEAGGSQREENEEGELKKKQLEEVHHVYKMPPFQPLEVDTFGRQKSPRIPEPLPPRVIDENFLEKLARQSGASKESLLGDHMVRWTKVRRRWKEAAANNETRYRESMDLLKDMFER